MFFQFKRLILIISISTILSCTGDQDLIDGKATCVELQTILYLRIQDLSLRNPNSSMINPFATVLPVGLCTDNIQRINTLYSKSDVDKCKNLLLVFPFQSESDAYPVYLYYLAPEFCGLNEKSLFERNYGKQKINF